MNQTTNNTDSGNRNRQPVIEAHGLSKRFGKKVAVDNVSLVVKQGDIFGFLGPNGSGKTTTIRMLCGLLTPDDGEGKCLGYDIQTQANAIKKEVGYMTQRFSFYEDLSIRENLDFVARVYGVKQRKQVVDETIERLGLGHRQNQLAGALSGGWKQRLALSACMLHQPKLLLLDEPTAGVDPQARRDFWEEIHYLAHNKGVTVLVSTHYMDEAERCGRLAYISHGRLLADGTPDELVAQMQLHTWQVEGPDIYQVASDIRALPAAQQVVPYGTSLHVSGKDRSALENALQRWRDNSDYQVTAIESSLEDVFIHLMQNDKDER
jgi:ABC-2 type transport system ATP-binding protein